MTARRQLSDGLMTIARGRAYNGIALKDQYFRFKFLAEEWGEAGVILAFHL